MSNRYVESTVRITTVFAGAFVLVAGCETNVAKPAEAEPEEPTTSVSSALAAPAFVDLDHDGIDDNLEQDLANEFAPVIFIEADESNYPVNVEWFLAHANLQYHEDCFSDTDDNVGPSPLMTQANLIGSPPWSSGSHCGEDDTGYSHPPHRFINTIATDPDGQVSAGAATTGYSDQQTFVIPDIADQFRVGSLDPSDWKTYFHAYPTADGGIMLQYWHVFSYNDLSFLGIGRHGGDWDATIHVKLGPDLAVQHVWFSRHDHDKPGDQLQPNQVTWFDTTHPLMMIDGGGHGAFAFPQDFCDNAAFFVGGTAAWPGDFSDPLNPNKLKAIVCEGVPLTAIFLGDKDGGTVWPTWDGGLVVASTGLTHQVMSPSGHGGMVNLGEYNPCTPTTCNGSRQGSKLLAGEFHPLNGQIFIQYEGKWGSLPSAFAGGLGEPPRNPVFQGMNDTGSEVIYTAWYNEGADMPASPATSPWLVPPTTSLSFTGTTFTNAGKQFLSATTHLVLSATQSAAAASRGSLVTFYRVYRVGSTPPAFSTYTGPFTIAPPDGDYQVDYYSVDGLRNQETAHSVVLTLDSTAPNISVASTVTVRVCDVLGEGSVIAPATAGSDASGIASIDGVVISSEGQTLNPPVPVSQGHLALDLGAHQIRWTVRDNVGNVATATETVNVTSSVYATNGTVLHDGAMVRSETSNRAPVGNGAVGQIELGSTAQSGQVRSLGSVLLRDRAQVVGPVFSRGPITTQNGVITEGLFRNNTFTLAAPVVPTFQNRASTTDVDVEPNLSRVLAPGVYRNLSVKSGAVLLLDPGVYNFANVGIEPNATIQLRSNGAYTLIIGASLTFRGTVVYPAGFQNKLVIGYLGTSAAVVERRLSRTDFYAPNAMLMLGSSGTETFTGSIFARQIDVAAHATVTCDLLP